MIEQKRKIGRKQIFALVLSFVILALSIDSIKAQEVSSEREIVKVGFFASDGYHVQDDDGMMSGYGYDFFKMAENYYNWKFEFVGYDKGWSDMLTMLDNGDIDVLTFAKKTPEREEKYDFSTRPVGTGSIVLTARQDDNRYVAEGADTYEGMTIGIERGTTHDEELKNLAMEKGFTYTTVYFDSFGDMKAALDSEEIDGMMSSSVRTKKNEKVLEEMEPEDYYAIVKKGNTQLLNQINDAIAKMDLNTPSWRSQLFHKYFVNTDTEDFSFDREQMEYIEQLKSENKVFTVVTNPDLAPYSSFDSAGNAIGIAPEIFERIADEVGIQYEYVSFDTYEEYNAFIREGKADIDLTCFSDYGLAADHGISLTNPYMSTTLAMLTRDTYDGNLGSIAELDAAENNTIYTNQLFNTVGSKYYETHADCIKAVLEGNVDATYLYTYTAQKAVEEDVRNRLMYSIMPEYDIDIAFGVNENIDYRLIAVLNEGIRCLEGDYIQRVIEDEVKGIKEQDTLVSLVYDYPEIALGISGILLIAIFVICLLIVRSVNGKRQRLQAQETSRFMGYVCEANETVMEVNLDSMRCIRHNMKDGVLISEEMPYEFFEFKNHNEMIHPDDFAKLTANREVEQFQEMFTEENKQLYFEVRSKDKNGEYRWYSYTIRAIPKSAKYPHNFVLFKKDIHTAVEENEKQKQALEDALETAKSASAAKGQFLSRMSHEIRTPLNAVIGYMEIAKDTEDNPSKVMHCVENSETAAKHLLSIINDVLDISSIESGKMKIANEEFDLKKQISAVSTIFFNQAKAKNVKFDVTLSGITQEWVIGDSLRLNQILMNLLSNAIKFTPEEGQITLSVEQLNMDEKRVFMKFAVRDTGIGMSEEYQKRLFEPFEQESAMTAQKYGGTGLGLSITYNLIKMMGGSVKVESKQNEGTVFYVSLSFARSENKQIDTQQVQHDYSHVRVLIVDDDEGNCEYMRSLLKRCKIKSDVAMDGESAIKQIKRRLDTDYKYDMCIMDWNMPNMNGLEAAKRIKAECDTNMPIVIATAYDITEFEDQAKEIGVEKIIAKPLFQSTMFDLLVSVYGKYEPELKQEKDLGSIKGLHILLAEDNPMNLEIAMEILNKAGLIVDPVADGQQAYDRFTSQPEKTYDAILMDVQMPVMNGYETTGAIRKSTHPEAKSIPIIAMTANAFAEDVNDALASGMNGHIAKPVDYDKLYRVLNEFCGKNA